MADVFQIVVPMEISVSNLSAVQDLHMQAIFCIVTSEDILNLHEINKNFLTACIFTRKLINGDPFNPLQVKLLDTWLLCSVVGVVNKVA